MKASSWDISIFEAPTEVPPKDALLAIYKLITYDWI